MKNKTFISLLICFFINNFSLAESFKFESSNLEIVDNGNIIYAKEGKAISSNGNIEINSDEFEFIKDLDLLKTSGNGSALIKNEKIEIEFDKAIIDQKNSIIKANGNVKILQREKGLKIKSDTITYDLNKRSLNSLTTTTLVDKSKNTFIVESFFYEIEKNLLKMENVNFTDLDNNSLKTSIAFINTETNKLFGKDVDVSLNNKSFNKKNEPRLKGNSVVNDNLYTEITKGVFTTCKKRDGCPPWQLSAKNIQHDKKNKVINYKNAWLQVYDIPVMYFPKFFHPDPTVKRRSGFLVPTIKSSQSSDNYLNIPYFFAIAENKDITFSPRLYSEQKILLQTEYRQVNLNNTHNSDFSFFTEKNGNTKNHFFYEYKKDYNFEKFDTAQFDFKIQQTSNDTYLKANKIETALVNDTSVLENSLGLNLYSNDLSINSEIKVYEDLSKNNNDRFEYIFPKLDLEKKLENKTRLNGNFTFKSQNLVRNYETNISEKLNINDLSFNSFPKISNSGFYNTFDFVIKNSNTDTKNSKNYKENDNYYMSGLFQFNSSLPLIKKSEEFQKILTPKMTLKISPISSKDIRNKETQIDVNNIYSINRISNNDILEGGASIAYGTEYSIQKTDNSKEILGIKLANNFRLEDNEDLPNNNQIGQKTSNFFSEISFSPNENFITKYNASIKNDLASISYENLITEFKINNFVTTFDYLNENNTSNQDSYLKSTIGYSIDESNSLSFSTRENKTSDLTEYYNFVYQYKNDCLAASIEYNKDYYNDRDVKPEETIFFKLTIIPFGETSSPNLKK